MTASIFKRPTDLAQIQAIHRDTAVERLGIEFTEIGPDYIVARMPVDRRTVQPMGILHGGASVLLAETLGSVAGIFATEPGHAAVGLDINANHMRAATQGWVTGRVSPIHLGRTTQVWSIEIRDDAGKMVCIARITIAIVPDSSGKDVATLSKRS